MRHQDPTDQDQRTIVGIRIIGQHEVRQREQTIIEKEEMSDRTTVAQDSALCD